MTTKTTIETLKYTPGVLYLEGMFCGECGVAYGLERSYRRERLKDHSLGWYCPNGHSRVFAGKTEAEQLREDLAYQRDRLASVQAERDQIEASRRAYKGQATKLRNRTLAGECPVCGQHLRDLARHIGRVHPDEKPEIEEGTA